MEAYNVFLFHYVWRRTHHRLQLYQILLQQSLPLRLQKCFVDSNTSKTHSLKRSYSASMHNTFSITHHPNTAGTAFRGSLGFSVFPKETSAYWNQWSTFWLVDKPLYLLSHWCFLIISSLKTYVDTQSVEGLPLTVPVHSSIVLTLVFRCLMFGHTGSTGEELETNLTLDQGLELPGVVSEHVRVVGPVMVPQAWQLLWQQTNRWNIMNIIWTWTHPHFVPLPNKIEYSGNHLVFMFVSGHIPPYKQCVASVWWAQNRGNDNTHTLLCSLLCSLGVCALDSPLSWLCALIRNELGLIPFQGWVTWYCSHSLFI